MVALEFGDQLYIRESAAGKDSLVCTHPAVPTGPDNLILRAAACFRQALGRSIFFDFQLEKKVLIGAGLGGGSSDAVAALKAMNAWVGYPLDPETLVTLAGTLGSDCPFFVDSRPALLSGRGEVIEPLPDAVAERLTGKRVLLLGPPFGISTAWAYGHLAALRNGYEPSVVTQRRLDAFFAGGPVADLLFNSFEGAVGTKYLAIPTLLETLRGMGHDCLMSGSGSVCFVWLDADRAEEGLVARCREAWGVEMFCIETVTSGAEYACAPPVIG